MKINIHKLPVEAGTHFAGQALAPDSLIDNGGLSELLTAAGHDVSVVSYDSLDKGGRLHHQALWCPAEKLDGARNIQNTRVILQHIYDELLRTIGKADFDIFLGGDCTVTLAIFAAYRTMSKQQLGLMYLDGDADLTLPAQAQAEGSSGILDSMVISQLTQREGCLQAFSQFDPKDDSPLITPENVVLFGFDPLQPQTEHWTYLVEKQFKCFTRPTVSERAETKAAEAMDWLAGQADEILVHFDVDVVDSGLFPLANYPHYAGLTLQDTMRALKEFLRNSKVRGLVVTEVNPSRDPGGSMQRDLCTGISENLSSKVSQTTIDC